MALRDIRIKLHIIHTCILPGIKWHVSLCRKKSGKLKTSYKREYVNLGCNIDIDLSGPTIYGWAVLGYEGWLAGYQMAFDTAKSKLSQNNFALGYKAGDFQLHTNV